MSTNLEISMSCPICFMVMSAPIFQCVRGHTICATCSRSVKSCPLCKERMTNTRCFQLESLLENLTRTVVKVPCKYACRGCKHELNMDKKEEHELECVSRIFRCEGAKFCKWDCDWVGGLADILPHFKASHMLHCQMQFNTKQHAITFNAESDVSDVQAIDFGNGQHVFWYKYKTDVSKQKAYWMIQLVGTKKYAAQYYYEFDVYQGALRKTKVIEICESDSVDDNSIYNSGKCVVIDFATIKSYLDDNGQFFIRFRIMKVKLPSVCN